MRKLRQCRRLNKRVPAATHAHRPAIEMATDVQDEQQKSVQNESPEQSAITERFQMAGAGGIEPPNGGIKIRCLTAWLRPNRPVAGNGGRTGYLEIT